MSEPWFFIADVGGTNARFASFHGSRLVKTQTHATAQASDLFPLARAFCQQMPQAPALAVLAGAGPVRGNAVQLTNARQLLRGHDLQAATGADQAHIINDFTAAAWATHDSAPGDLQVLAGDPLPPPGSHLVIGPGTGLGVGALIWENGQHHSAPGEGGHVGLSPRTSDEVPVFEALRTLWPEIFYGDTLVLEAEGILSGMGLPWLYRAVAIAQGADTPAPDSAQIFARAQAAADPVAARTVTMFKSHLAQVSGDLALAFGAQGGVFLVGGVAQKNPWLFDDTFIADFNNGGRFTSMRAGLNLYLLTRTDFGLRGAHRFALAHCGA